MRFSVLCEAPIHAFDHVGQAVLLQTLKCCCILWASKTLRLRGGSLKGDALDHQAMLWQANVEMYERFHQLLVH